PARLVYGDLRARRDAGDARDAPAEQISRSRVAGRDRRDVRAVAVRVFRRHELVRIELVAREEAVDVIARADDLVAARALREARSGLTDAVEAYRRVEAQDRRRVAAHRVAEPAAEPRRPCPTALAGAGHPRLGVEQRRMIRRDPAVDDADDHVFALQPEIRAQSAARILEPEEDRAVVRAEPLVGVRPDALDVAEPGE